MRKLRIAACVAFLICVVVVIQRILGAETSWNGLYILSVFGLMWLTQKGLDGLWPK